MWLVKINEIHFFAIVTVLNVSDLFRLSSSSDKLCNLQQVLSTGMSYMLAILPVDSSSDLNSHTVCQYYNVLTFKFIIRFNYK